MGPGALRGGGLPPGASGGTGSTGTGAGGAGMRGGTMPMGMMGGAGGAHGRGGQSEGNDDEHETPDYLIDLNNGNELFGDLPKASPGVIGDWTEHEDAEKRRREAEIKRYKSMGWDVKFD
ncbi:hypothetical protein FZI91_02280 [Mycobacterium sp. CBMA271]|nr:hypothetical protein [Mycobacteroides sp. CBMA 271]